MEGQFNSTWNGGGKIVTLYYSVLNQKKAGYLIKKVPNEYLRSQVHILQRERIILFEVQLK